MTATKIVTHLLLLAAMASCDGQKVVHSPVDYVRPNIGSIGQLLGPTLPFVQTPYGMARLFPLSTPGIQDRYLADKLYGFTFGAGPLMVSTGETGTDAKIYASDFDHDFETSTPYEYKVTLESSGVEEDSTATSHVAIYHFTLPASPHTHVSLVLGNESELKVVGPDAIEGSQRITGTVATAVDLSKKTNLYFFIQLSKPVGRIQLWQDGAISEKTAVTGNRIGFVTTDASSAGEQLEIRVGVSYISVEQAKKNLISETSGKTFETLESALRDQWNSLLSKISTEGGSERQETIFYTALWRSLCRMTDITEDGAYYSGYDHSVHLAEGHDFYVDDGLWDTFRSMHPLQLLLDGHRQEDMVRSYLRMYQQSGWIPSFPSVAGEQAVMIGHHADQLILDTYSKRFRDFDIDLAYAAMKNATQATLLPWKRGELTSLDHMTGDAIK